MNTGAKYFFIAIATAFFLPVLLVLAYNLYIDPFQIVHKDINPPTIILGGRGTDRYQQAGIINQYEINSMIIGNSHSANYLPSKIEDVLNWENTYTLTMDGATLNEQSSVARYALMNHHIKQVLWGLSGLNLIAPWDVLNKKLQLKTYLYDQSRINDIAFYLTFDLQQYWQKKKKRKALGKSTIETQQLEFDKATSWYSRNKCHFNRPAFVAKTILGNSELVKGDSKRTRLLPIALSDLSSETIEQSRYASNYIDTFSQNLLPLIIQNTSTEFNFVLTAFPTLKMQQMKRFKNTKYLAFLRTIREFVLDTRKLNNVKIYGFGLESFTNDLRLYKDSTHYHIAVNDHILEKIELGGNILNAENIDTYIMAFDNKISNYQLPENWNPSLLDKISTKGYLSTDAAQLLINASNELHSDGGVSRTNLRNPLDSACGL